MLTHLHSSARKPSRAVVLGAGGFIGGAIRRRLEKENIPTLAIGRSTFDLLSPGASGSLSAALQPDDTLIFVSAKAPVKNPAMLIENLRMGEVVCAALQGQPVNHVIYVSSDAVYKDNPEPLSETSCAEPGSLHGVMHLAREVMLRSAYVGPLALLRPTLVYGLDDPHNGYGPNRFRRLAAKGKEIILFGEGEERRDHVAVEDIAELASLIVKHRSVGTVNATSGEVVSFRELAEFCAAQFPSRVAIKGSPRSGPMPHDGYRPFAPSAALTAFPDFQFTYWRDGLTRDCTATKKA
ncbi:MAG: NAD(P)-dependent oxidoreductase [Verrucomicrobia bacterium]|nr:NAD(P)-dependent oxidoreductase [Verrucomicrobiota bacterium]